MSSRIDLTSGIAVNPTQLEHWQVRLEDVAYGLSRKARFNAQGAGFLSVAQHSVSVANLLLARGEGQYTALQGLLHDASEAYLADVPSPIKDRVCIDDVPWRHVEDNVLRVVLPTLGAFWPIGASVKQADAHVLLPEAELLGFPWRRWRERPDWRNDAAHAVGSVLLPMEQARMQWLALYAALYDATNDAGDP